MKDEEYKEFYRHITHDFTDPLAWSHGKVEGKKEYTSLLYVPARAPFDLWHREAARGLKLYVRRVFIMDDAEQFLPLYLRFVKGVVDSADLPLNISREMLQQDAAIDGMRTGLARRVLDVLAKMAKEEPEKYASFWKEFGTVLKEGPAEDHANRERIAKLLRFSSTHADKEEQDVSLEDYVARMKPEQKEIYFVIADNFAAAKSSPHLEVLRSKGIEVLLLSDRVDEWLVDHLREFDGKQLRNVARGELDHRRCSVRGGKAATRDALQGACRPGRAHQEVAAGSRERRARHEPPRRFAGGVWCSAHTISARRCAAFSKPQARKCRRPSRCWRSTSSIRCCSGSRRPAKTPPSTTCRCCYSSRRRSRTAASWRSPQRSCSGSTGCCSRCIEVIFAVRCSDLRGATMKVLPSLAMCAMVLLVAACGDKAAPAKVLAPVPPPAELQKIDIVKGTGEGISQGQVAVVHYTGWLYEPTAPEQKGTKFDSSRDRGQPFSFMIGAGQVIRGWDEGVQGMQPGGQRRLVIPSDLAYGDSGKGPIPGGATLVFDVELLEIEEPK